MSSITTTPTRPGPSTAASAARAVNVTKTYGSGDASVVALNEVTASMNAGQFTAIMGPSGSGKSTLLHVLAGLDRPTSGEIYVGDTEISGLTDKQLTLLRRDEIG
ncbi:MAG TPA: ATP-binding cassette domain-containing protein, partial [Mycobacteriales bacterium]|nr:ATP-binding cassette domain-containing protein [Mycobacteriales bacterium]